MCPNGHTVSYFHFVVGSIVVIGVNYTNVLPAFKAIFVNAFAPEAFVGGGIGVIVSKVVAQGFKRGVFSNEAGLGSSVMYTPAPILKNP